MNFTLTINGDSPAELLDALTRLGGTTNILNTPAPQPQSEPVPQPDKPKAQTPAKQKKAAQKPAPAPEKQEPENPTPTPAQNTDAAATTESPAASAPSPTAATQAGANGSPSEPDPLTENKIRSLIMTLMAQGRTKDCKAIISASGAVSISTIKPESYTSVWEQLCKLKEEVDANATG